MPEAPEKDPVQSQSLAFYILLGSLLLIVTFTWALWDEFLGLRPWKSYQREFISRYSRYLNRLTSDTKKQEKEIRASSEYQALERRVADLQAAADPQLKGIEAQVNQIDQRLAAVQEVYTNDRADLQSRIFEVEHASSPGSRASLQKDISKFEQEKRGLNLPLLDGSGKREKVSLTYPQLEAEFTRLNNQKAELVAEQAELLRPISEARKKADEYFQTHLDGLSSTQLKGLKDKMDAFNVEIKQINNPDAGIVDRQDMASRASLDE
jgi:chromosome segregation ATPase